MRYDLGGIPMRASKGKRVIFLDNRVNETVVTRRVRVLKYRKIIGDRSDNERGPAGLDMRPHSLTEAR
jgi:hypothetical protein